jgi:hypothetical protein
MIRRPNWLPSLLFAVAIVAAAPAVSALEPPAKKAEAAALKTQAQAQPGGRLRVVVELRVGPRASRRVLNGIQRTVITNALGSAAWRQRGGNDVHAIPEMTSEPHFVASVTPAEIEKLTANARVRRIVPEATWAPKQKKARPAAK